MNWSFVMNKQILLDKKRDIKYRKNKNVRVG